MPVSQGSLVNYPTLSIGTVALMLFAWGANAAESTETTSARPLSACLDPTRARSWHFIDSDEILVGAGRQRFHVRLQTSCPELGSRHTLGFRSGHGVGRICGNVGDAVLIAQADPRRLPCRIAEVTALSKGEYQTRLKPGKHPKGVVEVRESSDDESSLD